MGGCSAHQRGSLAMTFILGAAVTLFLLLAGAEVLFTDLGMPVAAFLSAAAGYMLLLWAMYILWTTFTLWSSQLSRSQPRAVYQQRRNS